MKKKCWLISIFAIMAQYACHKSFFEEKKPETQTSARSTTMLATGTGPIQVVVDPNRRYQTFKGFGVSLAWWANIIGGWDDATINTICSDLVGSDELNLNYFRFNIGGGDNPAHMHMRFDARMPGYKASASSGYNWTADAKQIRMLKKIYALRSSAIYEAMAYSPPYWMTNSGCSSGGTSGAENLQTGQYGAYADYLATIVKHFKDVEGVNFTRIEPFNECYSSWGALGSQEGCKYLQSNQKKLIDSVYKKMSDKGMLSYTKIVAMDGGGIANGVTGLTAYAGDGSLGKIGGINVHSYYGNNSDRVQLLQLAKSKSIEAWQTECGPLGISGTELNRQMTIVRRLQADLRDLQAPVWADWQAANLYPDPNWGYFTYDTSSHAIQRTKMYYLRKQFSRFIQPGYQLIYSNDSTTAALNNAGNQLVLVVTNDSTAAQTYDISLNLFASAGVAGAYRTSATEDFANLGNITPVNNTINYLAPAKSVTTFVIPVTMAPTNPIANGTYKITIKSVGFVMNVEGNGTANGAKIIRYPWVNTANEKFILTYTNEGYKIAPSYVAKVFDVGGQTLADGALLQQWDDWSGVNQRFSIIDVGGGYYRIVARHSGKCLYASSGTNNVEQYAWDNSDNVKWSFAAAN